MVAGSASTCRGLRERATVEAANTAWAETVAAAHGPAIAGSDPSLQAKMKPHPKPWRNRHPNDQDVNWVLSQYPDGIDRNDLALLAGAGLNTPAARRRAFVATIMWGTGTTNRYQGRHEALLNDPRLPEALAASVDHLGEQRHLEAFRTMDPLTGITYRFHTKWLWVVGRALETHPLPLVMDNRVWMSLEGLHWPGIAQRQGMPQRWHTYLVDAASVAGLVGVTPEHVEYWLFKGQR